MRPSLLALLLGTLLLARPAFAAEEAADRFYFLNGQTILFLGDSITYGELYVQYIDAFLATRFPDQTFHVVSRGIPSETVAGTSEPSHVPPRPDLHTRFTSTVLPFKPDVVVACYGMNDGVYLAPNEKVFAKYRAGIERLVQRIQDEVGAKPVLLTPPPYDHRPHAGKTRPEGPPDYRFPDSSYDKTLAQFSRWLLTWRDRGLVVVDQHTPMNEHLELRKQQDANFILSPDGIHPKATGHWLMAQAILLGLNAPCTVADLSVDASSGTAEGGSINAFKAEARQLQFKWAAPLPWPVDPAVDPISLKLAGTDEKLNRYTLTLQQLPEGQYELLVDGAPVGSFSAGQFAAGIDLMQLEKFPTHARAAKVLELVQQRRRVLQEVWIKGESHPRMASTREQLLKSSQATPEQADKLLSEIRALCKPREVTIAVVPAS